jgi:hypothetical protein
MIAAIAHACNVAALLLFCVLVVANLYTFGDILYDTATSIIWDMPEFISLFVKGLYEICLGELAKKIIQRDVCVQK